MHKNTVIKGLVLILLAVILGAFATHGLKEVLTEQLLDSFKVGVNYQLIIGVLVFILGLNFQRFNFPINLPVNLIFIGVCVFSISIYLLNLLPKGIFRSIMGPITPLGGLLMIMGIAVLLWKVIKLEKK